MSVYQLKTDCLQQTLTSFFLPHMLSYMNHQLIKYRDLLRSELIERCKRNASYSVRAFSRDLELSPGYVSQVLNGLKTINEERAHKISNSLKWDQSKSHMFVTLVRYENASDHHIKAKILCDLNQSPEASCTFVDLPLEHFKVISEWYHFAIVELSKTIEFESCPKWISRKLGITLFNAKDAIDRLVIVGLLERDTQGALVATQTNYTTNDIPNTAIRDFHLTMLEKVKSSLLVGPRHERNVTGVTMAVDPDRLGQVSDKIRKFRRELMDFLEGGSRKQIYQLSIQLFRLDKDLN